MFKITISLRFIKLYIMATIADIWLKLEHKKLENNNSDEYHIFWFACLININCFRKINKFYPKIAFIIYTKAYLLSLFSGNWFKLFSKNILQW